MTSPETEAKGDAGSAGTREGVPAAASVRARTTIRRASSILNPLSPEGLACASAAPDQRGVGPFAGEAHLRLAGSPGFQGNAAEREACLRDRIVLDAQGGRGR